MSVTHFDGEALKEALVSGLLNLRNHKGEVDALNVFPVPDGDTGTNMVMTMEGGATAIANDYQERVEDLLKKFARGVLLGARGNSGVILSQFFKGFALGAEGKKTLTTSEFSAAFGRGVEKAYESVIKPTEGTMLTVMREGFEKIRDLQTADFVELFAALMKEMRESLARTPDLLDVLKEAGVIDSGGAGFVYVLEGMEMALLGEKVEGGAVTAAAYGHAGHAAAKVDPAAFNADSELEFGYCTEFILQLQNAKVNIPEFDINTIIGYLESVGDSIVAVKDDDLVKVHVHSFKPGDILNYCQQFGEYISLKIENMSLQHNETLIVKGEDKQEVIHKDTAIIACVSGRGLETYFREIGADVIVKGGQTNNPSTEDFVEAFKKIDAKTIIILPCNSNIVMAAEQAAEVASAEAADVRFEVVKAKSVAEGYSALSMIDSSQSADRIINDMKAAIENVSTGLITTAVRDVDYPDLTVKEGDYIGLDGDQVLSDSPDLIEACRGLLEKTEGIEDKAVVAVFYGQSVDQELLDAFEKMITEHFPWLEYGFINGGQEVYDFILAIE